MRCLWLSLALVFTLATQAAPAECDAAVCWDVSPQICITEQQNQQCKTQLQLHWVSKAPLDTCLFVAEQKLHCWQNVTEGQWQQTLSWQSSALTLRSADNKVLLHTELHVMSRKPARRRLSSPWSIF
ncbi:MAG TPA: DUF3019 domain-containing protein [Rheinheimera sp.]|nr:DUF3019 domain-containing protein [Rheinheimera sp.]